MPRSLDSSTFSKVVVTPFTSKLFYFRNVIYATSYDRNDNQILIVNLEVVSN